VSSGQSVNTLHVVHCIDTEGPLTESLGATFQRVSSAFGVDLPASRENLRKLQNRELDLDGREDAVARMVAPDLLAYNSNWDKIQLMLDDMLSDNYRRRMLDDDGNGWVYSWHCMDHMGYVENPRHKDVGYGNVFRFYRNILDEKGCSQDELNWHFHPVSVSGSALSAATSYTNSYTLLNEILCRRILEDAWFPVVNRPGFHSERPDCHAFLEQWIPFDYANQSHEDEGDQPDVIGGRFGDWRRAPRSWRGYCPDYDDYQKAGSCRRRIFRCLNVGTRLRVLTREHVCEAFLEAQNNGGSILAFADHDYRDIRPDVEFVRSLLAEIRPEFPEVALRFSGAEQAAREIAGLTAEPELKMSLRQIENHLEIKVEKGHVFGPQPFLALMSREGRVYHDNLDVQVPGSLWTYTLDDQTFSPSALAVVGIGAAGRHGGFHVARIEISA